MKKITIDDLEWQKDPHYFTPSRTKSYYGRSRDVQVIVIHWWNEPDRAGTLEPTADYLERADTSIHFIVSGDRVIQMVNMGNTAFHARSANPISVGIEVDPNTPGNTYETVGALVRFIRTYYGNIPLKKHSDYVATTCPGTISLSKIEKYSKEIDVYKAKYEAVKKELASLKAKFKALQKEERREENLRKEHAALLVEQAEKIQALRDVHSQSKNDLAKKVEELQKKNQELMRAETELQKCEAELFEQRSEFRTPTIQEQIKNVLEYVSNKIKEFFNG